MVGYGYAPGSDVADGMARVDIAGRPRAAGRVPPAHSRRSALGSPAEAGGADRRSARPVRNPARDRGGDDRERQPGGRPRAGRPALGCTGRTRLDGRRDPTPARGIEPGAGPLVPAVRDADAHARVAERISAVRADRRRPLARAHHQRRGTSAPFGRPWSPSRRSSPCGSTGGTRRRFGQQPARRGSSSEAGGPRIAASSRPSVATGSAKTSYARPSTSSSSTRASPRARRRLHSAPPRRARSAVAETASAAS